MRKGLHSDTRESCFFPPLFVNLQATCHPKTCGFLSVWSFLLSCLPKDPCYSQDVWFPTIWPEAPFPCSYLATCLLQHLHNDLKTRLVGRMSSVLGWKVMGQGKLALLIPFSSNFWFHPALQGPSMHMWTPALATQPCSINTCPWDLGVGGGAPQQCSALWGWGPGERPM